ncbi:uncharacterized protein LOC126272340 [Schistocerca gregaria]|uniref:uncharacterized protein LOC126272340 n=1 Tax=Schistocerca gregaria TaxID=7010 RepID=UPI00211E316B|nr:uncharacterized protein LOC126272340 [Schistocerca gregaria]
MRGWQTATTDAARVAAASPAAQGAGSACRAARVAMECGGGGGGGAGGGARQQLVEGAAQRLEHIVRAAEASVGAGDVARLAGTAQLVGGRAGAGVAALLLPLATLLVLVVSALYCALCYNSDEVVARIQAVAEGHCGDVTKLAS